MSLGRGWRPALLGAVVWALASQLAAGFAAPTMRAQAARTVAGAHKILHVVRHGQAQHNVRAEPARANGCSYEARAPSASSSPSLLSPPLPPCRRGPAARPARARR